MIHLMPTKQYVDQQTTKLKSLCQKLMATYHQTPQLDVILVGNHKSSLSYVKKKQELCHQIGAQCIIHQLSETISDDELIKLVTKLNQSSHTHGIIIQLPLPATLNSRLHDINNLIIRSKDVDGFHPDNAYDLYAQKNSSESIYPCTPSGILDFLNFSQITISGKNTVVIGRSYIVGKPLVHLLLQNNANVTWCHSQTSTPDLRQFCHHADIIFSAIGKAHYLDHSFFNIHKKQLIIDIGTSLKEGKICGDVDISSLQQFESLTVTPVPGGVGPLTVTKLIENLLYVFEIQHKKNINQKE